MVEIDAESLTEVLSNQAFGCIFLIQRHARTTILVIVVLGL
jgi:hypothetical protein